MKKLLALVIVVSLLCCSAANAASKKISSKGINIASGSTYQFGRIRGSGYGTDPIEWIVLKIDAEENRALLLSKNILFYARYQQGYSDTAVTWETCSLREVLNNEFYKNCFNSKERSRIIQTPLTNDTPDKIFLLSSSEAREYLPSEESRKSQDILNKSYISENPPLGHNSWWLRTMGTRPSDKAPMVSFNGVVAGVGVAGNCGVRPALWLNLAK